MPSDPNATPLRQAVDLAFRPFRIEDRAFIMKSWLKSYRKFQAGVPDDLYFKGQSALIFELASRSKMVIACDATAPNYIVGFVCGHLRENLTDTVVHYIYIKDDYRQNHIARDLVNHLGYRQQGNIIATHWGLAVTAISKKYPIVYNPYFNVIGAQNV